MNRDRHQELIMDAARGLGVTVVDLQPLTGLDLVRLEQGDRAALVLEGRVYPTLSAVADSVCADKHATKALLTELGIGTPASVCFADEHADSEPIRAFLAKYPRCVVKPTTGTEGEGVLMHVTRPAQVQAHVAGSGTKFPVWMIEEQVEGQDLRMLCLDGRVTAACVRVPAFVTGNGERTVEELIEARRAVMRKQNPHNQLVVDRVTEELLQAQALTMSSVPAPGLQVQLKHVANMSQGGVAVDVTDQLHPRWHDHAGAIGRALAMRVFSLDAITPDPARDPRDHARVLELNARSQWLHHTFSEGKTHDIPDMIVRLLMG